MSRLLNGLFNVLVSLYGLLMIAGLIFVLAYQTDYGLWEFVKTLVLLAAAASPLLFILVLAMRKVRLALLLIPAVVAFLMVYVPYYWPKEKAAPPDSYVVRVMTFNTRGNRDDIPILGNQIRSSGADIIALQELSIEQADFIEANLSNLYPHMALHGAGAEEESYHGQGVISRYPITADEYWRYDDLPETLGQQRVELEIDGRTVVLYNTHPWPAVEWDGDLNFSDSQDDDIAHSVAIERLLDRVNAETQPLLWVGDFNMTDQFEEYEQITARYTDAWREVGQGMGYTFPEGRPPLPELIRIDYVFYDDAFQGVSGFVMPTTQISDHRAVVMTLALLP